MHFPLTENKNKTTSHLPISSQLAGIFFMTKNFKLPTLQNSEKSCLVRKVGKYEIKFKMSLQWVMKFCSYSPKCSLPIWFLQFMATEEFWKLCQTANLLPFKCNKIIKVYILTDFSFITILTHIWRKIQGNLQRLTWQIHYILKQFNNTFLYVPSKRQKKKNVVSWVWMSSFCCLLPTNMQTQ
jgi:hypothetical protein